MALLILPIIIPFATAILSLLFRRSAAAQRAISLLGATALLGAAIALLNVVWSDGIQATQMGDWPAPFGITLVADAFSAIMVTLAALTLLATVVYSLADIDVRREAFGYYPLLNVMVMGICGAFLTGDIFNLYVWFEVLLIASFVLMALDGDQAQMKGAIKYVVINLIASTLFLVAAGLLYGLAGTLNMADLAVKLRDVARPDLVATVAMLFLIVFGIKAAVFPLFFWLPDSYPTPPAAISAIFAGLLTKVGVYALIRVFTLIFVQDVAYTHTLILVIAGLTMVAGVLGALAQTEFRRVLSFLIVSQVGYAVMGLGLYTSGALAASVFYIIEDVVALQCLFLVSGVVYRLNRSENISVMGGIYRTYPGIALLFLIPALSLAGFPPLSGFFGKLALLQSGLAVEQYAIVATALVVAALTLFCIGRVWSDAFLKPSPAPGSAGVLVRSAALSSSRAQMIGMLIPVVVLVALVIGIGLLAEPVFGLATRAAEQLWSPSDYIQVVLGEAL